MFRLSTRLATIAAVSVLVACDSTSPGAPDVIDGPGGDTTAVEPLTVPRSLVVEPAPNAGLSVSWSGGAGSRTVFELHRSADGEGGTFAVVGVVGSGERTFRDATLRERTRYCYRVRALRVAGGDTTRTAFSEAGCAETWAIPLAPSGLRAWTAEGGDIGLAWRGDAGEEAGFAVERLDDVTAAWRGIATTPRTREAYLDVTAVPDRPACYRVRASGPRGESPPSDSACTVTPSAPVAVAVAADRGDADVTWRDASTVEDGYEVWRSAEGGPFAVLHRTGAGATAWRDTSAVVGVIYVYRVRALKEGGSSPFASSMAWALADGPLGAPTSVIALPNGSTSVVVRWMDGSWAEQGFRVQRSLDGGATWTTIAERGALEGTYRTSVTDAGRLPEQQACYRVLAFDATATSEPSDTDCATPLAAPGNLVSDTLPTGGVEVLWEDRSSHEDGYEAFYVWSSGYERIAEFPAGTTHGIVSSVWNYAFTNVVVRAFRTVHGVRVYSDYSNPVWVP